MFSAETQILFLFKILKKTADKNNIETVYRYTIKSMSKLTMIRLIPRKKF